MSRPIADLLRIRHEDFKADPWGAYTAMLFDVCDALRSLGTWIPRVAGYTGGLLWNGSFCVDDILGIGDHAGAVELLLLQPNMYGDYDQYVADLQKMATVLGRLRLTVPADRRY